MPALPTQTTLALSTAASPLSRQTGTSRGQGVGGCGKQKEIFLRRRDLRSTPGRGCSSSGELTSPLTRRANTVCFSCSRAHGSRSSIPVPRRGLGPFTPFRYDVDLHSLARVLVDPDLYAVGLVSFSDVIFDIVGRVAVDRDRVPHVAQHPAVSFPRPARAQVLFEPFRAPPVFHPRLGPLTPFRHDVDPHGPAGVLVN